MAFSKGTDVIYNGIELHNVTTRQWDQQVVYDESGTDPIAIRFMLAFEAILHLQSFSTSSQWVGKTGGTAADGGFHSSISRVHELLSQPRRILQVYFNGKSVLAVNPPGPNIHQTRPDMFDVDNGPKPQHVRLMHIVSNKVARVQFAISATLLGCPGTVGNTTPVLNNRWSVAEEMDG
ncbi:MAG TPA: hypothetical protein VMY37_12210, partial [Thermoguttaceae bacterium]|nr:hypothetical protein [Thermoguttaceae bacterium]